MKMNPEIKATWYEALRSGDYEQGTSFLHRYDEYCCLGVLCELAVDAGVTQQFMGTEEGITAYGPARDFSDQSLLPGDVMAWSGMNHKETGVLMGINDSTDPTYDFKQIADWIEVNL